VSGPSYPAARVVAARVAGHFARHVTTDDPAGEPQVATPPDAEAIQAIAEAAFWASLRREEGESPTISLAFLSPEQSRRPLRFERPLPVAAGPLTRLAPAVERPGVHLGVWRVDGEELRVWGITRTLPPFCFVLEVVGPGLLVLKHRGDRDATKFVNIAVLEGDQVKVVDESHARSTDGMSAACPLLGSDPVEAGIDSADILLQLAVSLRAHGRGGTLLVVPAGSSTWRESIVEMGLYAFDPTPSTLSELTRSEADARGTREWRDAVRHAVDGLAGLTAVDGATLITNRYDLLAFGAKLGPRDGGARVERVLVTEPVAGAVRSEVGIAELGGTRHLSAAQFVHDQRNAIGLVASQDGRVTVFTWSSKDQKVRAHRIDILLL